MYSQSEVKSLLINTQGDVIGCKVMVMPSGSVSEKHKKLIRRGELFQMILPYHPIVDVEFENFYPYLHLMLDYNRIDMFYRLMSFFPSK